MMKSSIIDVPRRHDQDDLFGIKIYQDALVQYIKLTDTPITIALQGEWGSGKTSLMNLLRWHLCDTDNAQFFPIWINTWQYSLMKTSSQAIISILEGIINQIGALNPSHKWEESKKKIGGLFKKIASVSTKVAVATVGVDSDVVEDLFGTESGQSDILQLKEEISKLIEESLKSNSTRIGFTFFIDDLDRIDPPVAVEILELLKNIFDLEHCIFILAIDYDVVIKGLKPKFGELTDKNEREFRSFFDKIIQLPFSMPVANYNIDAFLVDALSKINFFTEEEIKDNAIQESISELARLSVGTNPRSLKRLTNTLSLISIINSGISNTGVEDIANKYKVINFGLVCMQIAYPYIYNQLAEEPDFKQWNETIAAKLKLRSLTPDEQISLDAAEEFDEEWEKIVFRMCQKETHLSNRVFQVSQMLNKISELIKDDNSIGKVIEDTIELSAVTNLKAFDTPKKVHVFNRDTNNYKFEGKEYSVKVELVRDVIRKYIKDHPGTTKAMLQAAFPIKKNMETIFMGKATYIERQAAGKLNFIKRNATDSDFIETADEPIIVCSNWPTTSQGKPAEFTVFLEIVNNKLGYLVTQA